jgi:hypothetical protein
VAPAGAWRAELVGVAQPAMRRELGRTPPGLERDSRLRHAAGSYRSGRQAPFIGRVSLRRSGIA